MSAVFVTGATGTVGSSVVKHLLTRGERVVAGVRDDQDAARLPSGVEARPFTFGATPGELDAAMDGCDRLFLMRPPPIEDVRTYLFPVVDAARRRRMRQVAFLSLQGVQANRRTPHHAVEQYLRTSGAPFTNLRPNFFMQNLSTTYAAEIRDQGQIAVPAGRSHTAFIDARDIGRVAATVFTTPGHERRSYTLSGEQSLTYTQVARTMTDVLGRPIVYTRPSEKDYLRDLAARGLPQDYIDVQKMIYRVVRLNVSAIPNHAVRRLTGEPATTFRQFVADHQNVWASAPPDPQP
ncbi:SDR family oxidoreductase [Cellulosimicrobium cellulans]|uniref:SDR family oxidoreductase n=1 Tax=Cellulosimicrobium cellulans TaxID=1710 RepID=UPI0036EA3F2C